MAMEITSNYNSYAAQGMAENNAAGSVKKKETEKTSDTAGSNKSKNTSNYMNELSKLAPSVEFKVGNSYQSAQSGKTLTINPQLLEKMQNDPEKEKEMKEMIKGVESATKLMDGIYKASGWTVAYRHSYIDENGKYCAIACVRNDFMLNMSDKLREERKKNSEELIEKSKEKAAEKKEELEEALEEKKSAKAEEETEGKIEIKSAYNKAEQLLNDKAATSKDGMIYLYDTDMKTLIEAAKEDSVGKANTKQQVSVGANLDLQV